MSSEVFIDMPSVATLMQFVPPDRSQLFEMEGYYVWDGSLIRSEDGKYQLYASRWPAEMGFHGWLTDSHVIRAESDSPTGPFTFCEQLDVLNEQHWSADMAHNARVYRFGDQYIMAYIGTRWDDADPSKARRQREGNNFEHWTAIRFRQRIGIATAPTAAGPWTPCDHNPVIHPRPGMWDHGMTTNPALHEMPDGRIGMIYKSTAGPREPLWLGFAVADSPVGPYKREEPSLLFEHDVEDPNVWATDDGYLMLAKDMSGRECGIADAGLLYHSQDGRHWQKTCDTPAYHLGIHFRDESDTVQARFVERPYLYLENNQPCCLVNAVLLPPGPSGVLVRQISEFTLPMIGAPV